MLQTTFFNLRDLSLEDAAFAASTRLGGAGSSAVASKDFKQLTVNELKTFLESNNEIKLKNALKSIAYKQVTGSLTNEKALSLYTYVLKNVNCQDMKTKKMCFDFLITYMPLDDSAAYLAMNSVQQLLHHKDPQARELALTVLSKFKSKAALPLILQFSKDMMTDFDFKVRRMLSQAFRSCWEQGSLSDLDLSGILSTLLQDSNYDVVSSCIPLLKALVEKDGSYLSIVHGFYKRFIRDLDLFEDYCFSDLFYVLNAYNAGFVVSGSDDHICFINALEKILIANESSTKILYCLKTLVAYGEIRDKSLLIDSFAAALSLNFKFNQVKQEILEFMLLISSSDQYSLAGLFSTDHEFLEISVFDDSPAVQLLKVQILAANITTGNVESVFQLLQKYSQISNLASEITSMALYGVLECCKVDSAYNSRAMNWVLGIMKSPAYKGNDAVNNAAFSLVRGITTLNSADTNLPAVYLLTKALLTKSHLNEKIYAADLFPETKAGIIWLIGDYCDQNLALGAEVLKRLLPTFAFEDKSVRLQILSLSAKILFCYNSITESPEPDNVYAKMFESVVLLSKYDAEYDVVDRARTFNGLLNKCGHEIGQLLLQAPKNLLNYMNIESSIPLSLQKTLQLPKRSPDQVVDASALRNSENKVNDFSQKSVGISSADFKGHGLKTEDDIGSRISSNRSSESRLVSASGEHISFRNKRDYKLKSVDDFFTEESIYKAPQRRVIKKIIVEEETDESSENGSSTEEESSENDSSNEEDASENDSSNEEESSENDSSNEEDASQPETS